MPLTYLESCATYSVYRDEHGETVLLAHGSFTRLTDTDTLDLPEAWDTWRAERHSFDRDEWLDHLRETTTEPDAVDHIVWCFDCSEPLWDDNAETVQEGDTACQSCFGNYSECSNCGEYHRYMRSTVNDADICEYCCDNSYSYCEECDGYYHSDYYEDHRHRGCNCESPAQRFALRNDGDPPLANDTRVTIALPAGSISDEGMQEIGNLMRQLAYGTDPVEQRNLLYRLSGPDYLTDKIGATWQTREGNFTKRLSRYAHKEGQVSLPPEVISQVGNIARAHSTGIDFRIEVTRDLNLDASEFYHEDSCWWGSHSESRCALKNNGGFGLRTFNEHGYVEGRAWVLPLKREAAGLAALKPTFDTENADAFVVFNGYGDLYGYAPARIIAHMAGMTYRKIGFDAEPMYVNSGGYLIAPEDIAAHYTDGCLSMALDDHSNLYHNERRETEENVA